LPEKEKEIGGVCRVKLEGRKTRIRTEESNLCNMVADIVKTQLKVDFVLLNAAGIRKYDLTPAGPISLGFIKELLPHNDKLIQMQVPGRLFKALLEEGLDKYPEPDTCFPVVAGLRFEFDPRNPANHRVT